VVGSAARFHFQFLRRRRHLYRLHRSGGRLSMVRRSVRSVDDQEACQTVRGHAAKRSDDQIQHPWLPTEAICQRRSRYRLRHGIQVSPRVGNRLVGISCPAGDLLTCASHFLLRSIGLRLQQLPTVLDATAFR
jgi:hypothetical protein